MKFYAIFVSAALLMMPNMALAGKNNKNLSQEKVKHTVAGLGKGSIALGQAASASLLSWFIITRINEEIKNEEHGYEMLCAAAALVGIVTVPTLVYATLVMGRSSYQSFKKAYAP